MFFLSTDVYLCIHVSLLILLLFMFMQMCVHLLLFRIVSNSGECAAEARLSFSTFSLVTGQWELETEGKPGQRETDVFDVVIVSLGHFTKPHLTSSVFKMASL